MSLSLKLLALIVYLNLSSRFVELKVPLLIICWKKTSVGCKGHSTIVAKF